MRRTASLKKGWQEQKEIKNIMLFLQSHDVSTAHAARIYKTYGNDSIKIVEENPYRQAVSSKVMALTGGPGTGKTTTTLGIISA